MADADDIKEQEGQEEQKDPKAEVSDKKSLIARFLPWIIIFVVVLICACAGLSVGRLFAGSGTPEGVETGPESVESAQIEDLKADNNPAKAPAKVWYYDLDPVVANLNEPTVTRYVRASLTLEMSADMDVKKGTAFLDEKKPILINWLTVYLSSLGLEDVRGDKNLRSIQSYIRDAFNEKLFPDSKPQIMQVLIKEFPVQ
jgi:flagellar basal body-associated protein FliL